MLLKIDGRQAEVQPGDAVRTTLCGCKCAFVSTILENIEQVRNYYSNVPVTLNNT